MGAKRFKFNLRNIINDFKKNQAESCKKPRMLENSVH